MKYFVSAALASRHGNLLCGLEMSQTMLGLKLVSLEVIWKA